MAEVSIANSVARVTHKEDETGRLTFPHVEVVAGRREGHRHAAARVRRDLQVGHLPGRVQVALVQRLRLHLKRWSVKATHFVWFLF